MPDTVRKTSKETADATAATVSYSHRFAGRVGTWMLNVQSSILTCMLLDLQKGSVLDVGGGHAQVTPLLREKGYIVHTLVSSGTATEILLNKDVPRETISVDDVMDMPFAARSFDVVVSIRMMAHVYDLSGYLTELCRVADRFLIGDYTCSHGHGQIGRRLFTTKRRLEGDTRPYVVSKRSEIIELLEKNGFSLDEHVGQFALPLVLHRKLRIACVSRALEFLLRPLARRYGNPVLFRASRRDEPL